MVRFIFLAVGLSGLAACTAWPANGGAGGSWRPTEPATRGFRFDWRLSGDPAVAPVQVFDDGKEVWLQFAPGQALPAIFGMRGHGEQALPYLRRDPYVVVVGEWDALRFRGGRLVARAERAADIANVTTEPTPSLPAVGTLAASGPLVATYTEVAATPDVGEAASFSESSAPHAAVTAAAIPGLANSPPSTAPTTLFRAGPPDATLRAVLARWADSSGWTFQPQHWAVDVDIPLSASADFSGDFKSAVRELLGATELAETPLQPCFYGNQVLRVVPLAQSCSRSAALQGGGA
ncbi:MAG: TcpQ domain-containing protein [Achromobacter pestifer]